MKKEVFVLGNNVVSDYFSQKKGYRVEPYSWLFDEEYTYETMAEYKAVIYCEEKRTGPLSDLLSINYAVPNNICAYLKDRKIPFVYISTAELYNGNYDWEKTKEELLDLNISSDYLLTKRIAERVLEEKDALILRIKNPFSEYSHPDNWLQKLLKEENPSNWMDCHSYLPDLERCIEVLLLRKKTGIYNVVQTETGSDLHYLLQLGRIVLNSDKFKTYTPQDEMNDGKIGADINSSKMKEIVQFQPMNFAVIYCTEKLKNNLDNTP